MSEPAPTRPSTIHVNVHLHSDDPFRAEFSESSAGPFVTIRVLGPLLLTSVFDLFVTSPEQADSLIRAAVTAKDLLMAAQVSP